jgi:hypothetical protein
MVLLALAGLWALAFGRISITSTLSLEGRRARFYGLALLVAAPVYGLLGGVASGAIAGLAPGLAANEVLGMVARFGFLVAIIVGLVPLFREKPAGTIISVHKS